MLRAATTQATNAAESAIGETECSSAKDRQAQRCTKTLRRGNVVVEAACWTPCARPHNPPGIQCAIVLARNATMVTAIQIIAASASSVVLLPVRGDVACADRTAAEGRIARRERAIPAGARRVAAACDAASPKGGVSGLSAPGARASEPR